MCTDPTSCLQSGAEGTVRRGGRQPDCNALGIYSQTGISYLTASLYTLVCGSSSLPDVSSSKKGRDFQLCAQSACHTPEHRCPKQQGRVFVIVVVTQL